MTRFLIADPDPAFRKALALLLTRKLNVQTVDEAADTGTLIHMLAECAPDVLLLNWSIHGTPGLETSILVRNTYHDLKIVLFSVDQEDASAAHSIGAEYIYKGAPAEEIVAVLQKLL